MQRYNKVTETPMEVDNSSDRCQKSAEKEGNKTSNDPTALINEATYFAEKLNDRLKSLNEEDAQIYMENFERHVLLLPKKKEPIQSQPEQLTTQKSGESMQDFVMVNPIEVKNVEKNAEINNEKPPLFGTSSTPPSNAPNQTFSSTMIEREPNEFKLEKQCQDKVEAVLEQNKYYHIAQKPVWEDPKFQKSRNCTWNRSISAEHKNYSSNNSSQSYSDVVKGAKNSTISTAIISSNENKQEKTPTTYSTLNYRTPAETTNNSFERTQNKLRSVSSHNTHRNHNILNEKIDVQSNDSKTLENSATFASRPLALHAIPTQVSNVTQQQNDWLQGSQKSFRNNGKKSINILVLGQTGVGKSTWINAFANYLSYSTLEDAIAAEDPVCVIPTKFTLFDENYQRRDIILGNHSNEVFSDQGQSATQNAKTYLFEKNEFDIYIIDTPGMDDTRGSKQDDENVQMILRAIVPFKELHAICFLFKANESRLTQSFKYCISKLLGNLSKSALNNTCFVFTNARGTFYKPGDTMSPLKAYFKELQERENLSVTINDSNTFCLDNEAFRFICAYFSRIKFNDNEVKSYGDSWKHSSREIIRLLNHASRLQAHNTSETLSINDTRNWIYQLVQPIINVSGIIQENLQQLDEQILDLERTRDNIFDLQKRADIPYVSLEITPLSAPQTVCTSEKCIQYEEISGKCQPIYKTVCHENCTVTYGDHSQIPDPALQSCILFSEYGTNYCTSCKCGIKDHKRIFYKQRIVTNHLETQLLQNSLASEVDASKCKQKMIRRCQQMIDGYLQELDFVMNAMAKFSLFLYQNGISQKADIFEKHLENATEREERMLRSVKYCSDKTYNQLIDILHRYRNIRDQLIKSKHSNKISLIEIQDIRQKLFSMPLTGSTIVKIFDIHVEVDKHDYEHNVTVCDKKSILRQAFDWTKEFIFGSHQK